MNDTTQQHEIPRVAVRSVAGGLMLMVFFTCFWGAWAAAGVSVAAWVIATACGTSVYGFYMMGEKCSMLARQNATTMS